MYHSNDEWCTVMRFEPIGRFRWHALCCNVPSVLLASLPYHQTDVTMSALESFQSVDSYLRIKSCGPAAVLGVGSLGNLVYALQSASSGRAVLTVLSSGSVLPYSTACARPSSLIPSGGRRFMPSMPSTNSRRSCVVEFPATGRLTSVVPRCQRRPTVVQVLSHSIALRNVVMLSLTR